jgi:ppGpp synthetase/RelA/SpoT-type nucleotidyltranferase
MAIPISRSELDRLGARIAETDIIATDDLATLGQILIAYREALGTVAANLLSLGFTVTYRLKTIDTLVDKLRREHSLKLKSVQDIAGARVVVSDRRTQNQTVAAITNAFQAKPARVRDRRAVPSSGYRAVHVVVFVGNLPIEVQVRTKLQDLWAQTYERLGDRWGRAIRYDGHPDEPDEALAANASVTRAELVDELKRASDQISVIEGIRLGLDEEEAAGRLAGWEKELAEIRRHIAMLEKLIRDGLMGIILYAEGWRR